MVLQGADFVKDYDLRWARDAPTPLALGVDEATVALVPHPWEVSRGRSGTTGCVLHDGLVITHAPEFAREAAWFQRVLASGTGWDIRVVPYSSGSAATIQLSRGDVLELAGAHDVAGDEGYRLSSIEDRVTITAPSAEGAFYALQTLRQLLPDSTFRGGGATAPIPIPELTIVDAPRFAWRGVLLDVARHFMPAGFLLKLIDLIALHKCNVLHLHLTDDQGWRPEIAGYPRLTEIGAWRREPGGSLYGGFYTRDELDAIVAYAAERHVRVLPEIDMPGHMLAAIAAYPSVGNTGERLVVDTSWGVSEHVLNLEETTLQFCTDVLDEVARIFPGPYVHVGGDECPTTEWTTSPRAQEIMRAQGYDDERQLQGWFSARVEHHLAQHQRRLVGWDDLLESGAPNGAILMAWQNEERGVAAVEAGHDVVMVPQEWLYFDRPASDDPEEPAGFPGVTTLEKVYLHDLMPDGVPANLRHHVLGAQCQLWTEFVRTPRDAEYQYFPRLCAFAENAWTFGSGRPKSFAEFEGRLEHHLGRLRAMDVNFRPLDRAGGK
jgi:hexosaminidase